jgi:hypothetical protein
MTDFIGQIGEDFLDPADQEDVAVGDTAQHLVKQGKHGPSV